MADMIEMVDVSGAAVASASPPPPRGATATPAEELSALVTWGAAAFYWAEAGQNPAVRTYWDALHYIATSLSVGYANIFPVTAIGKAIGAVVMMVGPALSARALDEARGAGDATGGRGAAPAAAGAVPGEVAVDLGAKLDAILVELRRLNEARSPRADGPGGAAA
jgi:hypothetical protein